MAGAWPRQRRLTPNATRRMKSARRRQDSLHVSGDRHSRRQYQDFGRLREHRPRHGPRDADPHAGRCRLGAYSPLAPSIPLAHGLRPAAKRRGAAHRRMDQQTARSAESGNPAFINIGQRLEVSANPKSSKPLPRPGSLAPSMGRSTCLFPTMRFAAVQPPKGMTAERFAKREKLWRETLKRSPLGEQASNYQQESMIRAIDNAHRLLNSPERAAFDLSKEPKKATTSTTRAGSGWVPACAAVGRSRRAVHRGHNRIRAVRALGHARKRP